MFRSITFLVVERTLFLGRGASIVIGFQSHGRPIGGEGGVIGLDAHGTVMMSFNTTGMGRGYVGADGKPVIMFTANDTK